MDQPELKTLRFGKIEQVTNGKAVRYYRQKDGRALAYEICCDCSLTHAVEIIPRKNYIRMRVWRDEEKTAWLRSKKKKKRKIS